jgi:excisionase family DNA binding protein
MRDGKDFYSPDEVAVLLKLHVRTVRRYIREGRLKASRIGKQYRVAVSDLDALVGSNRTLSAAPVSRRRRVLVSTTVDIDAIGADEAYRITTALSGAFNAGQENHGGKRLDCIYYEEQGRLRIIVNAQLETANAILGLIGFVLTDGSALTPKADAVTESI